MYSGSLNTICSLTGIDTGRLDLWGGLESIAIPAMKEIVSVAKADGVTLPEDVINLVCHRDDGDYFEPSMRVDVKKGNPIELEAITNSKRVKSGNSHFRYNLQVIKIGSMSFVGTKWSHLSS